MRNKIIYATKTNVQTVEHPLGFGAGINNTVPEQQTGPDEVCDGLNMFLDQLGGAQNRRGNPIFGYPVSAAGNLGMFTFTKRDKTQFELGIFGSILYRLIGTTWTPVLGGTFPTLAPMSFCYSPDLDSVIMSNGFDPVGILDGNYALTINAALPKAKVLCATSGRILFANTAGNEDTLYISDLGLTTVRAASFQRFEGNIIQVLPISLSTTLVITERKVYRVNGFIDNLDSYPATTSHAVLASSVDLGSSNGAIAPRACINIYGNAFFLGLDSLNGADIYVCNGQRVYPVGSQKIKIYLNKMNTALLGNACAVQYGRYYRLAYTPVGDTLNTSEILLDVLGQPNQTTSLLQAQGIMPTVQGIFMPLFRSGFPIASYATVRSSGADIVIAADQNIGVVRRIGFGYYDELPVLQVTSNSNSLTTNPNTVQISAASRGSRQFVLGQNTAITSLAVFLQLASGTPSDLVIRIETDTNGQPSGTLADATASYVITGFPIGNASFHTVIPTTSPVLQIGTVYHLVVRLAVETGTAVYSWGTLPLNGSVNAHVFANGVWSTFAGYDLATAIFVQTPITSYITQTSHYGIPQYKKKTCQLQYEASSASGAVAQWGVSDKGRDATFTQTPISLSSNAVVWATGVSDVTPNRLVWAIDNIDPNPNAKWSSLTTSYSGTLFGPTYVPASRYVTNQFYYSGIGDFRINSYLPVFDVLPTTL